MRILLLFNFLVFCSIFSYSQSIAPEIKFNKKIIDYGEITTGSNGIKIFKFTNVGTSPLEIKEVYSSCGCTIPKKPQETILPGEQGEIQVKYDTNRLGNINKTITVKSNAIKNSIVLLKIKGLVKQD